MAENDKRVFIVATANDVTALPPELIRKGRLDEIFFVDLPGGDVRKQIFAIHLSKRQLDPSRFDLDALGGASDGFTGAEIEQAIVAARYAANARDTIATTELVLNELANTKPLSVVRAEDIERLRNWVQGRTVSAD
jgi:SpoVK/Ycf46/Vps4 family AAA+-type ATPase